MKNGYGRFARGFLIVAAVASGALAKDKTPKPQPKDTIEVVGHIPLSGSPVVRFQSTQHYSSYYLYAEHDSGAGVTLIDVTKAGHPSILADVPYAPNSSNAGSQDLLVVAGTAALVDSGSVTASAASPKTQTLRIMDFSDPQHPTVAREFTGVTAIGRNDARGLIFVANSEGIWILQQHLAEDPAVQKAYDDYLRYYR
jgi:hypothetical protein